MTLNNAMNELNINTMSADVTSVGKDGNLDISQDFNKPQIMQ